MEINTIYNEDCLATMKRMPAESVDLILTDPPYGMAYENKRLRESGKPDAKEDARIVNDDNLDWLPEVLREFKRILKPDAHAYIFCSHHHVATFINEVKAAGLPYKSLLIWDKSKTGMGDLVGDYAPSYELIIYCSGGKPLKGKRDNNIIRTKISGNELHPTQKPLELITYFIRKSSEPGDLVFDGFMGSGTTAVAAHMEGRKFIGSEIDKKHYKTCTKRIGREQTVQTLFSDDLL